MRFTAYAGTSVVLATGVIIRALHERANFYSACVYLAQSNACLMILTNIALLGVSTAMLGLQRLFYGPLRPIEVEQLYEKAWFAITETCLAMTIFREEVGGWFLIMFVSLLIGKVWAWIGEGRVEILEQQPPTNPRLFHARLSVSLVVSSLFDLSMLQYSVNTVLLHARPNMMVMFAFEFAVLAVSSISTALRYGISVFEANVIRNQTKDRRAQMRRDREQAQSSAPPTGTSADPEALIGGEAAGEDIDSMDIDVPGWEEKGRWIFYLDLTTDFFKLVLYLTFFCVLCMFYGMPIHIIRDVALTIRSFYKRITDFVRYRQATRDMNAKYPDAAPDEVAREDVCIICREDMRPWSGPAPQTGQQAGNSERDRTAQRSIDERLRPKKLPCGHILHFACLRSWLERQQNCPTCRRPVLDAGTVIRSQTPNRLNHQARALHHLNPPQAQLPGQAGGQRPAPVQNVYQFGPLRIAFGARPGVQAMPQQVNPHPIQPNQQIAAPATGNMPQIGHPFGINRHLPGPQTRALVNLSQSNLASQLYQIEQQLMREAQGLRLEADQLQVVRALQGELARLRTARANPDGISGIPLPLAINYRTSNAGSQPSSLVYGSYQPYQSIDFPHHDFPPGVTVPEGWTVLPLRRLSGSTISNPSGVQSTNTQSMASSHPQHPPIVTDQGSPRNLSESALATHEDSPTASEMSSAHGALTTPRPESLSAPTLPSGTHVNTEDSIGGSSPGTKSPRGLENPRWGSALAPLDTQGGQESEDAPESTVEQSFRGNAVDVEGKRPSQSTAEGKEHKGKGKAATVEDSAEDVA